MAPNSTDEQYFQLPLSVVTKVDVGRLSRELKQLDNLLTEAAIRNPGTQTELPKLSRLLDETMQVNKVNLQSEVDRRRLVAFIAQVRSSAPIMHISFGADPSPLFTQKLITWLRSEIHPLVLLQLGLQPNIGAGSMIRTTNKYFDFSLRQRLSTKKEALAQTLSGVLQ